MSAKSHIALWMSGVSTQMGMLAPSSMTYHCAIWLMYIGHRIPSAPERKRHTEVLHLFNSIADEYVTIPRVDVRFEPDSFDGGIAKHKIFIDSSINAGAVGAARAWFKAWLWDKLDERYVYRKLGPKSKDEGWYWPDPDPLLAEMKKAVRSVRRRE